MQKHLTRLVARLLLGNLCGASSAAEPSAQVKDTRAAGEPLITKAKEDAPAGKNHHLQRW